MSKIGTTFYVKLLSKGSARRKLCGLSEDMIGVLVALFIAASFLVILTSVSIFQ